MSMTYRQVDRPPNDPDWDHCIDVIDAQSSPGPEKRWLLDLVDGFGLILNDSAIAANVTKARRDHARHLLHMDSLETKSQIETMPEKRQAAGAFLDPSVYAWYGCGRQDPSIQEVVVENEGDDCSPDQDCPAIVPVEISGTDGDVPVGPGRPNDPSDPPPTPTTTSFIECTTRNQQPGSGITKAHCICDGSTFEQKTNTQVTPANSCAYTTKPPPQSTITITTGGSVVTQTDICRVCTINNNNADCTSLANCTPIPTSEPTPPPVDPSPGKDFTFEIYHLLDASFVEEDVYLWLFTTEQDSSPCFRDTDSECLAFPGEDCYDPAPVSDQFPEGRWRMDQGPAEGCVYEGTATEPGTFFCDGFPEPLRCRREEREDICEYVNAQLRVVCEA